MKLSIRTTMLACLLTISCSSVQTYFKDRGNDALDIINIGAEKNIYGVRISAGIPLGFQKASSGVGFGLRGGYFGKYFTGDNENKIHFLKEEDDKLLREDQISPGDSNVFFATTSYHKPNDLKDLRACKKQFQEVFPLLGWTRAEYLGSSMSRSMKGIFRVGLADIKLEISVGTFIGFRIGLSVFETIDFIFGIFGFDFMRDDSKYNASLPTNNSQTEGENLDLKFKSYQLDERIIKICEYSR